MKRWTRLPPRLSAKIIATAENGGVLVQESCFKAKNKPLQMRINLRRDSEVVLWLTACWFTEWDTESSLKKKNNLTNSHQIDADKPHLKPMAHPQKPTVRQMSLKKSQQERRVNVRHSYEKKILTTFMARSSETAKWALCERSLTLIWCPEKPSGKVPDNRQ